MDNAIALEILRRQLSVWRSRSYRELTQFIDRPQYMDMIGPDGKRYQIQALWDSKPNGDIRVLGAIDDGGWRAIKPLCEDFIVSPSGEFVGE